MPKSIAVYGNYTYQAPVKQRYWKKRVDGVRQRYWKIKRRCFKKVESKGRYEFSGRGGDLYQAVIKAHRVMPRGYVDVPAEKFVEDPERYGVSGSWIDREIES